ncbi:hypothetical protein C943_04190 [Mariniradius saccharolyticus AK6]|uniref:Uncharacterized protein n=1 Tax=Mariniradius saccharolyticus AK6 TaxID=1239962 RepID=M7Y9N9_9BACT|nr:hypothetical protein [Mariniradius saccharolyticus]EMS33871.1 hypothetical protein C943_04190 [Mariniradius saccharolyticus AK6]
MKYEVRRTRDEVGSMKDEVRSTTYAAANRTLLLPTDLCQQNPAIAN